MSYQLLRILERLGLIWDLKVYPQSIYDGRPPTVRALVMSAFWLSFWLIGMLVASAACGWPAGFA